MRNLEDIESDLAAARETLSSVEGTPTEVYSRIVGYYRSVRNWNKGKREEYGERQLYRVKEMPAAAVYSPSAGEKLLLLLFTRSSCPGCTPAKDAAGKLGIPVELVNADTADGLTKAIKYNVMSTPTAILLSMSGEEITRAGNAENIERLLDFRAQPIAV